jgi:hypothetical protein
MKRTLIWLALVSFVAFTVYADTKAVMIDGSTHVITNAVVLPAGKLVFPDTNPYVTGAGYWAAGVLTRSAGTPTSTPTNTPTPTPTP